MRKTWTGFSVERVRINQPGAFDYDWQGETHYLAVHDIMLRDGEISVGGERAATRTDLCDRLTFVPSGARVSGWSSFAANDQGYTAIFFDPGIAEAEYERPVIGLAVRPLLYFEHARLCHTLRRLEVMVSAEDEPEPIAAETLGLLAVLQLYPLLGGAVRPSAGQLTLLQQRMLDDFLESAIGSAISLSALAAVVGLSRYHFTRCFSRTYGRAPHQHVQLRRIGLAASYLAGSDMPVSEIALRVGFSSPSRFSIAFRRVIGRSPRAFRNDVR